MVSNVHSVLRTMDYIVTLKVVSPGLSLRLLLIISTNWTVQSPWRFHKTKISIIKYSKPSKQTPIIIICFTQMQNSFVSRAWAIDGTMRFVFTYGSHKLYKYRVIMRGHSNGRLYQKASVEFKFVVELSFRAKVWKEA